MATPLDMSLDDLIKQNKKPSSSTSHRRPSAAAGSAGPTRRGPNRARSRPNPYPAAAKAPDTAWKHDLYAADQSRPAAIETGTRLNITNLDYGVSEEDIKELFAEVGDVKRSSVNYDRSGRSLGTAVVVFARRADALEAIKKYHNVQLDGKPMKIELVGRNVEKPAAAPAVSNAVPRNLNGKRNRGSERGNAAPHRDGIGGRGQRNGGGRRGGRGGNQKVSAEDLDADLDKYHAGAMDTTG